MPHRGSENNSLFVLNHFTLTGAIGINTQVVDNMIGFIGIDIFKDINSNPFMWNRIAECQQCLGRIVNFVVVDFWESSDVVGVSQICIYNRILVAFSVPTILTEDKSLSLSGWEDG